MKLIITGYNAAPADKAAAAAYYAKLLQIGEADGLGFAWNGPQTPAELADVLALLPRSWSITLNDIPATLREAADNPSFGLASPDESGRRTAVEMLRQVRASIQAMNDRLGRRVVLAVEIHSAPATVLRIVTPSSPAFQRSLDEVAALDWDGAALLVEHCDAYIAGQTPAKGFLTLADEIAVLSRLSGSPIGLSLNWGRSMIELRDPERVIDHVTAASNASLLRALTFSGASEIANDFGDAWADMHLPFAATDNPAYQEPTSGMTADHVRQVVPYIEDCLFLALKTNWPASRPEPLERAASIEANFATMIAALRSK